jgi:iron-sulfur cluster repair protein YtfE (RIC family)
MNRMIETIRSRHQEMLDALSALGGAVVADAEGTHSLQLAGFLRHKLLPHMHSEEHHLYVLVDGFDTERNLKVTAGMTLDHQFVECQIASIDECLRTARHNSVQDLGHVALHRKLEILLARLDAVLRMHLRREEDAYLAVLRRYASHEIEGEIRLRMQRVYGDGETIASPSETAVEGSIS